MQIINNINNNLWQKVGAKALKTEAPNLPSHQYKGMIEMRKYYSTIEKTTWTSKPALTKMIDCCNGNIGKPIQIDKVDNYQKTFSHIWAKLRDKKISSEGAIL